MRRWCLVLFLLLCVGGVWLGCSKQEVPKEEKVQPDGGVKEQPKGKTCLTVRDCEKFDDCRGGLCVSTDSCQDHSECKQDERCVEDRCIKRCDVDSQCPKEHVCVDGMCHKPAWKTGKLPNEGSTKAAPLRIGLAVKPLDHPLGISMAGYGFRPGPKGPYAKSLGGSEGMYDRFNVKALVIDNGIERIAIVRSPLVFTTDFLVTQINQRIVVKTGLNFIDKILMISTHSHSAPARFWNLLPKLNFGAFGGGDYHPEVFGRLADSFAEAIIAANEDLKPGKLSYTVDNNFDPEKRVFSNRRGESPGYRHPHLMVIRAERADGTPIAALLSFPMHGTISSNNYMTNDAAGGLEYVLQEKLEQKYKTRVEVFFLQGCAGDISPRGDHLGHHLTQMMQMLGHNAAPRIVELYDGLKDKGQTELPMEIVNRRIPISYKDIGYTGEFFEIKDGEKRPLRFGAFQCVQEGFSFSKDPDKRHEDGKLKCVFSVELLNGAAVPQFSKTRLTALRLGDLVIATFPGESTSTMAKGLVDSVMAKSQGKIKDLVVVGYSQDHQLYLLREEDWWRGGYEASTTIWGPKIGEYLIREASALTLQLTTPEKEKNETGMLPQDFYGMDWTPVIPRSKTTDSGKVTVQPPKQYKRLEAPFEFSFAGGFIGVDHPRVILQKKEGTEFKDVMRPGGQRVYDDSDFRMIMEFRKVAEDRYIYSYRFEELEAFPAGTYRFRMEGFQWDGQKKVAYKGQTETFEIVPTDRMKFHSVESDGKLIRGFVRYPAGTNDDGKSAFPELKTSGHQLRSPLVRWEVGPPVPKDQEVQLKITVQQGGKDVEVLELKKLDVSKEVDVPVVTSRDKDGKEALKNVKALSSGFEATLKQPLAAGTYQVTIEVTDAHGNTGKWGPKDITVK